MLVASLAATAGLAGRSSQSHWDGKFKTLVTFGDSFTDEGLLGYFINNNGSGPPVGTDLGVVSQVPFGRAPYKGAFKSWLSSSQNTVIPTTSSRD
jgi:hypothetical protein